MNMALNMVKQSNMTEQEFCSSMLQAAGRFIGIFF